MKENKKNFSRLRTITVSVVLALSIAIIWFVEFWRTENIPSLDSKLAFVIEEFELKPIHSKQFEKTEKYKLGQALFFDPVLSGNRDVSCSTCHLIEFGSSDGLPLSIGEGGVGAGPQRLPVNTREIHPKNSMDLWNRDHNDVTSMFWDGRLEVPAVRGEYFRTPLGDMLPSGLENLMAVQSLFPLLSPNEMLGYPDDLSANTLPNEHSMKLNTLADSYRQTGVPILHSESIFAAVILRLLGELDSEPANVWQSEYRILFGSAFEGRDQYSIADVANSISHFIELSFSTRDSDWDEYLSGELESLTESAKRGALYFYGKGRCAVCHSGETFSDYSFHSIGVIDEDWRIAQDVRDVGRYAITGVENDLYKFRTPPLRNVLQTAPYFHNGSESSLYEVIRHHSNPTRNVNRYHESGRFLLEGAQVNAISPLLQIGLSLGDSEIHDIISFLGSLNYRHSVEELGQMIPESVPSQLEFLH